MKQVAMVIVGILCLVIVGGVWALIRQCTALLFGDRRGQEKEALIGIGLTAAVIAVVVGLAAGIAYLAGV